MKDGFIKVATATPIIRVGDCQFNIDNIKAEIAIAEKSNVKIIVFPELSITGYTCSDLFLQKQLLDSAIKSLEDIINFTKDLDILCVVGLPIASGMSLYNCGAVVQKGELLALIPKKNIPAYSEFYETRHFTSGVNEDTVEIMGKIHSIDANVIIKCSTIPDLVIGVEICEDLWVANSPSIALAENGATVILNLSASNEVIGKPSYRKSLVQMQSAKLVCAYLYADAGFGESTTDMIYSSHNIICENGTVLAEGQRYTNNTIITEIDVQKLNAERRKMTTFAKKNDNYRTIYFNLKNTKTDLTRYIQRNPFVPNNTDDINARCYEILTMQATGLATRLKHTGIKHAVIGLSGGLDSTLALIVTVHAFKMINLPFQNIITVTMPCFGTTNRTKSNAQILAETYDTTFLDIDITNAVKLHFNDIKHSETQLDVTYENSQARERTQILMDLSNKYNALVVGTGDLSELALGWATYNGDHMSMYAVNASVPKTLVRYLTQYEADNSEGELKRVLTDVINTPVSPELLPPKDGEISQKTEELVGPYDLHDFFLYYLVRFGYTPTKIYRLAKIAFKGEFSDETIKKWLIVFIKRFFTQQFKRSCMPDAPKVGTVTLSPRGDFRMPSDASVKIWLKNIEQAE